MSDLLPSMLLAPSLHCPQQLLNDNPSLIDTHLMTASIVSAQIFGIFKSLGNLHALLVFVNPSYTECQLFLITDIWVFITKDCKKGVV